jgi:hypothetical protein
MALYVPGMNGSPATNCLPLPERHGLPVFNHLVEGLPPSDMRTESLVNHNSTA